MSNCGIKILLIVTFLIGESKGTNAFYSRNYSYVSLYYGLAYQFDNVFRKSISIDNWDIGGGCVSSNYSGFGFNASWVNKSEMIFGARCFLSTQRHPMASDIIFYLGLEPTLFITKYYSGVNIAPQFGLHCSSISEIIGVSINACYGYDVPLINDEYFSKSRHRFTLKAGIDLNRYDFKYLFMKKENRVAVRF